MDCPIGIQNEITKTDDAARGPGSLILQAKVVTQELFDVASETTEIEMGFPGLLMLCGFVTV